MPLLFKKAVDALSVPGPAGIKIAVSAILTSAVCKVRYDPLCCSPMPVHTARSHTNNRYVVYPKHWLVSRQRPQSGWFSQMIGQ